ncbi:hypothetical protein FANTH_2588 [Fusarium anthophilum]|uniref:Uncharacterized protein n=1 Tax=Fusarium anthophilum TaxID=48485 RepID=A0A8H4ZU56_9HYPO|nr:hypothetical protein FANTH_2588 [Fusarium anthophilum]
MATTRNMTQIRLFRLPPEVILLITEDDSLEWEDLRRLRHHTWQWLSDHGFELSYSKDVTGDVPEHHRPFSADLLYMVWDATEAEQLQATCDLCDAVRPFLSDEYDLFYDAAVTRPPGPRRVHKFIIGDWWNPWEEYFVQSDAWRRLKLTKEALGEEEFSKQTQRCWEGHYDFEGEFLDGYFTYDDMPEWDEVDYEEWRRCFLKTFTLDRILAGNHFWISKHLKTELEKWCEANGGSTDDVSLGFKWWKQRIPTIKSE